MLPYLNKITDYDFISKDVISVINSILSSLILHIKDTKSEVEIGFMIFGLKYNPSLLKDIVNLESNRQVL